MHDAYQEQVLATFQRVKTAPVGIEAGMPVTQNGQRIARLEPVTWADLDNADSIALFAEWRAAAPHAFPAVFPVTLDGTKRWLQKGVLETPDRLLFWLVTNGRQKIGHMGLFRFNFAERHVEVDNIVRGVHQQLPGVMHAGLTTLINWTFAEFQTAEVRLTVFADNDRALRLYDRLGFTELNREPLRKEVEGPVTRWVSAEPGYHGPIDRHYVHMTVPHATWQQALRKAA